MGGEVDLVVADLSFISLVPVLPALLGVCRPGAPLVLLVKPQFEAGRAEVSRGRGVVRDPAVRTEVQARIDDALRAAGATIMGWVESPLRGADGNVELFVHRAGADDGGGPMTAAVIVAHHERGEAAALAASAARWLRERDIDVWMPRADAAAIDLDELGDDRPAGQADLAISLGGDGTMLRTVELVGGARTTILGVNVGQLGYLTEVEPAALTSALERYVAGAYEVEERMMLAVDADPVGESASPVVAGAERGRHRAAGIRPHRPPPRAHRRGTLHQLRRGRPDRGHADRARRPTRSRRAAR